MRFYDVAERLKSFRTRQFGKGVTQAEVRRAEGALGVSFPADYTEFLRQFGWGGVDYLDIYGLGDDVPMYLDVVHMTKSERTEMEPPIPDHLVPIMNDGAGNHYCLDTRRSHEGTCPVVFWDHDSDANQVAEIASMNFSEWLAAKLDEIENIGV